eukprot:9153413-Pyramimonas_sp.AAC.1
MFEIFPGRCSLLQVGGMVKGGFLLGNIYLKDGGNLADFNWSILTKLGYALKAAHLPFVIAGGWQIEPTQLEAPGWTRALDAEIVAPTAGTCTPAGRTIDFF